MLLILAHHPQAERMRDASIRDRISKFRRDDSKPFAQGGLVFQHTCRSLARFSFIALLVISGSANPAPLFAADHGDAPNLASDRGADIADLYLFLDPNDNSKVTMILTIGGFIVPGENVNFGLFDPTMRYAFQIENTGDAQPDKFIDVTITERVTASTIPTATIRFSDGPVFTALTTPASNSAASAPAPIVTTDPVSGVSFFAGLTDDPFFFDIPAFARFTASARAGTPNVALLQRGRDSFAGYNILAIALNIPASLLRGSARDIIGANVLTQRRGTQRRLASGAFASSGPWITIDRTAVPAVNVALIGFDRKNAYNAGTTEEDAKGRFATEIVSVLKALGTNDASIAILASVAVSRGDFLRLDTRRANSGPGGGNNPGAAFPNGRRLADDVVDTLFFFIANQNRLGDSVDANELPFRDAFPFLAPAHQPRTPGTVDDQTRN
ncbi:MAG TPA: DUF4331 family protein [Thermoanaerobaculia bacterium]|nr:DUF4331 family protein [Thermoanaerobaculia bacterium]